VRKLIILTDTDAVEVRVTPSGAYAVTNDQGHGLVRHNFFTLEEAAEEALKMVLQAVAV
jgi:hypothetical protein